MSSHNGSGHFRQMRWTSFALLPLVLYFLIVVISLAGAEYATVVERLASPLVWLPVLVFIVISVLHMWLGMQVIIDDYVKGPANRLAQGLSTAFSIAVAALAVYAIYQLSFGA